MYEVASVMINGNTLSFATKIPFTSERTMPARIASTTTANTGSSVSVTIMPTSTLITDIW